MGTSEQDKGDIQLGAYIRPADLEALLWRLDQWEDLDWRRVPLWGRVAMRVGCSESDVTIRNLAVELLGALGNRADHFRLVDRLKDSDWVVRCSACSSLANLSKKRAVKSLRPMLKDRHPVVRRYAAVALWEAGGADEVGLIAEALQKEKSDLARVGMLLPVASAGDETAIASLHRMADSDEPWISYAAADALKELGEEPRHEDESRKVTR